MRLPVLKPRWFQLPAWYAYHNKRIRNHLWTIHRRGGKDTTQMAMTVEDVLRDGGVHYYVFPTKEWARRAIWKERPKINGERRPVIDHLIPEGIHYEKKEKELCVYFPHNDGMIQLAGSDDLSFIGQGGASYTLSEFSVHKREVTGLIAPILDQSDAPLRLNGTLRGRNNPLYEMLEANRNSPEWFVQWLKPEHTKCYCWVDEEMSINPELADRIGEPGPNGPIFNVADRIKSGMISHALAMQEYMNEAVSLAEHGYFTRECRILEGEGRKNDEIRYDPTRPVFTFWDLGKGTSDKSTDTMVCLFVQFPDADWPAPKRTHIIDCHESIGRDWSFYAQMLNSRGYWYGGHFAPWDIRSGKAGWGDKTNLDLARERGIDFIPIRKTASINEDIELCRRHLANCWFGVSEEVETAFGYLMGFHQKVNRDGVPMGTPEHDHSSNTASAFRQLVRAIDYQMVLPMGSSTLDHIEVPSFAGYF